MFGHKWRKAQGTIVTSRAGGSGADGSSATFEYVVDVSTQDGEFFRALVETPHLSGDFRRPDVGDTVPVEVEEKSRKVRFDTSDPRLSEDAARKARRERFDETLAAPPGTPARQGDSAAGFPAGVFSEGVPHDANGGALQVPFDVGAIIQSLTGEAGGGGAGGSGIAGGAGIAGVNSITGSTHVVQVDPNSPEGRQIAEMARRLLSGQQPQPFRQEQPQQHDDRGDDWLHRS